MAEDVGGIVWTADINTGGLTDAERRVDRSTRNITRDFDRTEKAAGRVGGAVKRMAVAIGSAIAVQQITQAVNSTVQSFAAFEKGLIGVGKTTDITGKDLQDLGEGIRQVSREVPVSIDRLLGLAQAAGQLGVKGSRDILQFTKTLGQLELATDLAGDEGARSLARLLNITGESISDIDRLGSSITELGNNFATTEAEIVQTATYLGPATQQFNLTGAEVVGLSAALRSMGQRAETSGSAVGAAMAEIDTAIARGGDSMQTLIDLTGQSATQLRQSFQEDATGVMLDFAQALDSLPTADQTQILDQFNLAGRETRRVIGALASDTQMVRDAIASSSSEWERNIALTKEVAAASKSFSAQMQLVGNAADEAASAVGAIIAPAALDGMHEFRDAALVVADNIDEIVQVARVLTGIVGGRLAAALAVAAVNQGKLALETGKTVLAKHQAAKAAAASAQAETAQAAATVRNTEAVLSSIIAERNLEAVRLKAQITDVGRTKTLSRMAELRRAEVAITAQLTSQKAALSAATDRQTAAQARANVAATAGTTAMRGLRSVMGVLGGPTGIIFMVVSALAMFMTSTRDASSEVEELTRNFDLLTEAQRRNAQSTLIQRQSELRIKVRELNQEIREEQQALEDLGDQNRANNAEFIILNDTLDKLRGRLLEAGASLGEVDTALADVNSELEKSEETTETASQGMDDVAESARKAVSPVRAVWQEIQRARENIRAGLEGGDDPFGDVDNSGGGSGGNEPDGPQDPGNIGLTSLQQLRENSQKEMQILQENYEAKELSELEFQERMAVVAQEYSNRRQEIMQGEKQGFMGALEEMGVSFESLQNQAVGALTSVATGMQSGSEAAKDLARAVLTQVIGAIVKMGIQSVATQLFATGASKAAATAAGAAWAAPAALASLATLGSNSVPAQAAIGTTVGMATALGAGSGRLYGGPVDSGNLYPVNEDGRPEMLTQNGRQYLLPGARGEVTSNKEMTQNNSGGNVTVNQTFQGGQGMDSQQLRNMVFDANVQDAIYSVMQRQNAKRGRKM